MKKNLIIIIAVIILLVVAVWYWQSQGPTSQNAPVSEGSASDDTTTAIDQDLRDIDLGNLDQDFQSIDADLNNL